MQMFLTEFIHSYTAITQFCLLYTRSVQCLEFIYLLKKYRRHTTIVLLIHINPTVKRAVFNAKCVDKQTKLVLRPCNQHVFYHCINAYNTTPVVVCLYSKCQCAIVFLLMG